MTIYTTDLLNVANMNNVRVVSGENALGEKCTSSSDCDYSHGRCVKYDKCETGKCGCDYGYMDGGYKCKKCEFLYQFHQRN